ncbi:bifunctional DNA primase/polymerase [Nesterenkonia sp. PF2B19]|uniref:bifunctional DNA primase/polymerase n=1 Tax=Nesterenkonia sp. PF2B19 TaxID=1881858 RepID=UPI0008727F7E|nr:bifunctional DNA primase/polymerase [Nesterenkonia sp. PF2B19]
MSERGVVSSVLLRMNGAWPLSTAAREFARAGVPVFPCASFGKRPATGHGFHDATTNLDQIEAWWRQSPGANIGVPTGASSGVVVVDVDVHGPVSGFSAFERAHDAGLVGGWQLLVSTPSGGMHAYYPATPSAKQRSWQAARAGVDFRGDGGYIIVPPSVIGANSGSAGYRMRRINTGRVESLDSDGLREFLDPRPAPAPRPTGQLTEVSADRLAAWVADRVEGERNRGLFWAACRLAESGTPPADTYAVLGPAAEHVGLTQREVSATIRSAYRTTQPQPRTWANSYNEAPRRAPSHTAKRVLS